MPRTSTKKRRENKALTVFITGIHGLTKESDFAKFIRRQVKGIKSVSLPRNCQNGGYAFVEMVDKKALHGILKKEFFLFKGRKIVVRKYMQGKDLQNYKDSVNSRRLFVCSVPKGMSDNEFLNIFSEYGTPEEAYIIRRGKDHQSRGFGYVVYDNKALSERVASVMFIDLDHLGYEGKYLKVKMHRQPDRPLNHKDRSLKKNRAPKVRGSTFKDGNSGINQGKLINKSPETQEGEKSIRSKTNSSSSLLKAQNPKNKLKHNQETQEEGVTKNGSLGISESNNIPCYKLAKEAPEVKPTLARAEEQGGLMPLSTDSEVLKGFVSQAEPTPVAQTPIHPSTLFKPGHTQFPYQVDQRPLTQSLTPMGPHMVTQNQQHFGFCPRLQAKIQQAQFGQNLSFWHSYPSVINNHYQASVQRRRLTVSTQSHGTGFHSIKPTENQYHTSRSGATEGVEGCDFKINLGQSFTRRHRFYQNLIQSSYC